MTQYERMEKGLLYDPGDPEIMNEQVPFQDRQSLRKESKMVQTKKQHCDFR